MPSSLGPMRSAAAIAALLTVGLAANPAFAKERSKALNASDVLARARLADSPPANKTEIEEWEIGDGGLTGTQQVVRRGHDLAVTTRLGPFTTGRGHVGNTTWHQDENGITVLDREPVEHVTARALERVSTPFPAYVVLETLADGHVRRSYYDERTYVLLRRERWLGGHFSYTAWDDFHLDSGGRPQAFHFQGDDGDGATFDYHLRSDRLETNADEALLSVPRNRRTNVEFPANQRAVRLPARFDRKRILVHVTIGKHGYDFLLDTGASGIVLSNDTARQLGLETYGSGSVTGATELASERVIVPLLDIGGLKMRDAVLRTAPLGEEERSEHVSGLLGFDFIASAVLRVDYEHGTLDAYENASFTPPPGAKVVDIRLGEQIPATAVAVGRSVGDDFFVDTGASTSLLVFSHFASAHPQDVSDDGVGAALAGSGIGVAASGIGGRIGIRPVQVRRVRFGSTNFDDPLVYVAESPHALGRETADGIVGADVLSKFTVFLNYAQSRILLEPTGSR